MPLAGARVSGISLFDVRAFQFAALVVAGVVPMLRALRGLTLAGFLALAALLVVAPLQVLAADADAPAGTTDEVAIPPLTARVTDLTGTLSAEQKAQLDNSLAQLEAAKGAQVAILMLPSTRPEEIEQYGIRLAEAWKIGRKGVDDGVIVIVAKQDRRMRIEVGYGLEGALPDVVAKQIISDLMTPRFKQGDYFGGLQAAVDAIAKVISGEALPPPEQRRSAQSSGINLDFIFMAMVFVFVVGGVLRSIFGRALGAGIGGMVAFLGGWLLLGSLALAAVVAVVAFVLTLIGGGSHLGGGRGGFGGGGFGGGGLGGGGFGGGGGGFGGGGSSGSW